MKIYADGKTRRRKPKSSLGPLGHAPLSALLVLFCMVTVKSASASRIRGTGAVDKRSRTLLSDPGEVVGGNGEWEEDDDDDDVETKAKSAASDSLPGASVAGNTIQTGNKDTESTPTDGAWDEDDDEEPTNSKNENEAEVEAPAPQLSHTTPIPDPAASANGPAAAEDSWGDDDDAGTDSDNEAGEHAEVESPSQTKQQSPTIPIPGSAADANGPAAAEDSWGDDDDVGSGSENESVENNAAIINEEKNQMDHEETKPTVPTADETSDTLPSTIDLEDGGDANALMDAPPQGALSQTTATNMVELSTVGASDQGPSLANNPAQSSATVDGDYDKESDVTLGGQATTSVHRNQSGDASFENNESVANDGISAVEQPGQVAVATEDQVSEQTGDQAMNQDPNGIPPNIANDWRGYEDDEEDASFLEMLSFTFNVIILAAFLTSVLVIRKRVQERLNADSTIDAATALREEVTAMLLSLAAWSAGSSGEGADNAISRNASSAAGTGQSSFGQETVPLSTAGT